MENARRAQQRLAAKGFTLTIDGDFGGESLAALMSYVGQRPTVSPLRKDLGKAADKHFPAVALTRPLRIAHVLAQQSVETAGFSRLVENFNYSVDVLMRTFSRSRISEADCRRHGRKEGEAPLSPARQAVIANIVYGGEFGRRELGNKAPGDGYRYRGRGAKQTTGLSNYTQVATLTQIDVVAKPELLENPDLGMRAATIFWSSRNCNRFADADDIRGLTVAINGGTNGLPERTAALKRAKEILL
jgi:putative chitinase